MFTSFASCDTGYFQQHAKPLISSAIFHGNNLHVHVIGNYDDCRDLIEEYELKAQKMIRNISSNVAIQFSLGPLPLEQKYLRDLRTYYACDRFINAPEMMNHFNMSVLVLDIDCYFMQKIEPFEEDVRLFLREPLPGTQGWEAEGTRVAAGAVFYNNTTMGRKFASDVRTEIIEGEHRWFADQVALNKTFQKLTKQTEDPFTYGVFDSDFMDWEFRQGTAIWTGKGSRKYENQEYLKQKKIWEDLFDRMSQ
jgi:hypothetical protein